jgi:hypothetical protein
MRIQRRRILNSSSGSRQKQQLQLSGAAVAAVKSSCGSPQEKRWKLPGAAVAAVVGSSDSCQGAGMTALRSSAGIYQEQR